MGKKLHWKYGQRKLAPPTATHRNHYLTGLLNLAIGLVLSGCSLLAFEADVFGLAPVYPQNRVVFNIVYMQVDSLQPELRWEALPLPLTTGHATEVTYELKIWKSNSGLPGDLIYTRDALPESSHKLEQPLEPSTKYLWTVRARFLLDGHPRVTFWGMSRLPRLPVDQRTLSDDRNPNLYRFETPPQ